MPRTLDDCVGQAAQGTKGMRLEIDAPGWDAEIDRTALLAGRAGEGQPRNPASR
jgi:hypothetical protein